MQKLTPEKTGTFHDVFCKTGIDPEKFTKETPKPIQSVITAEEYAHQYFKDRFTNR